MTKAKRKTKEAGFTDPRKLRAAVLKQCEEEIVAYLRGHGVVGDDPLRYLLQMLEARIALLPIKVTEKIDRDRLGKILRKELDAARDRLDWTAAHVIRTGFLGMRRELTNPLIAEALRLKTAREIGKTLPRLDGAERALLFLERWCSEYDDHRPDFAQLEEVGRSPNPRVALVSFLSTSGIPAQGRDGHVALPEEKTRRKKIVAMISLLTGNWPGTAAVRRKPIPIGLDAREIRREVTVDLVIGAEQQRVAGLL